MSHYHMFINTMLLLIAAWLPLSAASIPPKDMLQKTLNTVYAQHKKTTGGKNADYIPELAKVNPALFGIAIVTVQGDVIAVGDADVPFAIESISKPFVYALALQDHGEQTVNTLIGTNATGHAFNSVLAIEEKKDHRQNALVNAGAIQVTSLIKGKDSAEKWQRVLTWLQSLSDNKPYLGQRVYESEMATNQHNRAIAELLNSYHMIQGDALDAVDRYTKACSVMMTAKQLALMGANLANHGQHPITHKKLLSPNDVKDVLSQMMVNGLYENSGNWLLNVGIPAKSGVGGGILAIVPGKMAIAVFSPPLDNTGNSTRAQAVLKDLSQQLHLHVLMQQH